MLLGTPCPHPWISTILFCFDFPTSQTPTLKKHVILSYIGLFRFRLMGQNRFNEAHKKSEKAELGSDPRTHGPGQKLPVHYK